MFTKAQKVTKGVEKNETKQSVQCLLSKEVFLNISSWMEILEEILQAHKHLTRLLEKYLDDELMSKKYIYIICENKNENGKKLQSVTHVNPNFNENDNRKTTKEKDIPTYQSPTTLILMLGSLDKTIMSYFMSVACGFLSYYHCYNTSHKVRRLVDY